MRISEVFQLRDGWHVCFNGMAAKATWQEKGPALAALDLLSRGLGTINTSGEIVWSIK